MKIRKLNESLVDRLVDTTCTKCGSKVKIIVEFEGTSYNQKPDITCFRCPKCGEVSDYINESIINKYVTEDASAEWKPNTSFKHIRDIYNKVKANNYKFVNNEREEFTAAVKKAESKGYKPEECRQIKDWNRDIWQHNRKNECKVNEPDYSGAVEYDDFKIYGDEETLRQLERDLSESLSEDVPMEYTDSDSLKALADEDEYYNKQRARRKHNLELLHKIFDSHGYRDSEERWTDKVFDIFRNAEEITVVDDASKVPSRTNDGQKVRYVFSTPDTEVDVHVDVYGDYVWVVTKQPLNEDLSGKYSDKFRQFIRNYTDSATIVGLVDDIVRYAKEDDLKDLYFERGYDELEDDEVVDYDLTESFNEKDILNKLDQFKSQITIKPEDEKALKDILLKKNISFKIDDSKEGKLTFKLKYKKLNEDIEDVQTVQRYLTSELPDILLELSDKIDNIEDCDVSTLLKHCRSFYNLCESMVRYYNRHSNLEEDLTDVATATLNGPTEGPQFGLTELINTAMQNELETVNEYNTLALNARSEGFEDIANVIDEINTEENKHIGQLQELLKTISPNAEAIEVGKAEGEQQIDENIETVNKSIKTPNTNDKGELEEDTMNDWQSIYDKFKQIEKDLNGDGEAITAVIDNMYNDNKGNPAYEKAYKKWADGAAD